MSSQISNTENESRKIFTLVDVSKSLHKTITERYGTAFWLKAEMNKLNLYKHSGHCYPELVEKQNGKVLAQMRGTLWKDDYRFINQKFLEITSEPLKDGIKILMLVKIGYESNHGLTLRILDIDPSFTLGDLEKEKQDTIKALIDKNIFNLNKSLHFPLIPKRIAIISVETSKGYADFMKIIESNPHKFRFDTQIFPSLLQGDGAVDDICQKLQIIKGMRSHFDAVVIVRGGGGEIGLTCYNHLKICENIATFPLPVLTGIGHATNETITEMIAHFNAITPTKLAEWLIQKFLTVYDLTEKASKIIQKNTLDLISIHSRNNHNQAKLIANKAKSLLLEHQSHNDRLTHTVFRIANQSLNVKKQNLNDYAWKISSTTSSSVQKSKLLIQDLASRFVEHTKDSTRNRKDELQFLTQNIHQYTKHRKDFACSELNHLHHMIVKFVEHKVKTEKVSLGHFEKDLSLAEISKTLKRGFSLSTINGKAIKSVRLVKKNSILHTRVEDGLIISSITEVIENGNN
ncbi:MAG: exodeoxyribonuclease VII large subunit [Cytophagales bacterium]